VLTANVGGSTRDRRLPKPKDTLRDALNLQRLVGAKAKIGDEVQYAIFEPMYEREITGSSKIVAIEERMLEGASTRVFTIQSRLNDIGIESTSYVTERGKVLEDLFAGLITRRMEPKEIAQDVNYSNDVLVSNAALIDKPLDDPRGRPALTLTLKGPLTKDHLFCDDRQTLKADGDHFVFTAKRESLDGFKSASLPIADPKLKEWLKPTALVQSADPKLVSKAREIIGDEKDTAAIAARLCAWVHDNVRTTYTARMTNALEVLEHPEGDCTEHSILFVGLARAAGVPAREVAGLIYVDGPTPGFYFHQWAKVWVGKWIDVDPTFNQPLADVTHVKLAEGDLYEQTKLVPIIGQLQIQVTENGGNG
jgi:hypothetical protein